MSDKNKKDQINEFDKLVVDIRNNLTTRLSDLMSKLLNSAHDKLFDLSDEADNNEDQTRYFELMNQLKAVKPIIAADFDKSIRSYLVPAHDFESKQKKEELEDDDELSLIGQDEMEGMVMVKSIADKANSRYREQLSHLEARLEHLSLKTSTVFTKDALMPTHFCEAFNDALGDEFDNANKKLLFGMFDAEIANKLDALYDSINNRLIDAGILPQIKLHASTPKNKSKRPPPPPQNPEEAPPQEDGADYGNYAGNYGGTGQAGASGHSGGQSGGQAGMQGGSQDGAPAGGNNISGFAMTAAPGGTYRHSGAAAQGGAGGQAGNQAAGAAQGASGGTAGSGPGGSSATGGGAAGSSVGGGMSGAPAGDGSSPQSPSAEGGANEFQHYTAGMPASQVGRVLGNFLGGAPITPEVTDKSSGEHTNFFPESTQQHFGHQEIIHALSSIQGLPQFDQPEEVRFDGEAIKQAVLAEIAKTSGGAVTKRINQIAEKTIDFIELIFDAIIDDEDISDTIKTLLLRLQIPIIKASMSDQEFFIYDDHPARVLLDTIADVGVGITDHTDDMFKNLDKIVSNILGEHDLTTETFQNALDNLNTIIEEQEAIARAKEEEEQQQLLRKHARATVLIALRATTTGKTLPEAVHPLILKRWPTLMFNHYLKNGKENNEWVNLVLTLRHIVESVQPISSPEHLARIGLEKDELFERTEDYLNIAINSKKDVENVMANYRDTIQSHIDDANFSEEEVSVAEEVVSNEEPKEEAPIEEESTEPKTTIPSNIMPGMWFQVYMGDDQTARRCKLSVIIVEDENLMFVNHKGVLVVEKSFEEFNQEIADNRTKVIMGHSAFDHAFKSVINRLN